MIGFFKFILSLLVIASHTSFYIQVPGINWFNQGISAVIPFFIMSGYFTSLVLDKKYKSKNKLLKTTFHFFKDRFLKISPQYYLYTILGFLFIFITQPRNLTINFSGFLANISIISLNLHQYVKLALFTNSYYDGILPPTWYLAALFQYYLLAPLIHRSKISKAILWLISGSVFLLALFNFIPNNFYSYRFIGNFIFFLIGDLIYHHKFDHPKFIKNLLSKFLPNLKSHHHQYLQLEIIFIYLIFIILTIIQFSTNQIFQLDTNPALLFGFLFFAPITFLLLKNSVKKRPSKIDSQLSSLSFSIYLSHYVFVYIFDYLKMINVLSISNNFFRFALITFSSVIFTFFIEKLAKILKNLSK